MSNFGPYFCNVSSHLHPTGHTAWVGIYCIEVSISFARARGPLRQA